MCKGCDLIMCGRSSTELYLDWFQDYKDNIQYMKKLNKHILKYQEKLDYYEHRHIIDAFRRSLIRIQKDYAKAITILNDVRRLD